MSKIAEFAVKTQGEATGKPLQIVKILKVERQVVAGLNYRLEIEVADRGGAERGGRILQRDSSPVGNRAG